MEKEVSKILDKYFIVRIAWVFGVNGNNFIKTMLNVVRKKKFKGFAYYCFIMGTVAIVTFFVK